MAVVRGQKSSAKVRLHGATDASDWGAGAVADIDGSSEEASWKWTAYETALPINWRELNGVYLFLKRWGPRLDGSFVHLEVDNLSSVWALRLMRARAPMMAELIRRIAIICAVHGIDLDVTHLAGKLNVRPDGISRGEVDRLHRFRIEPASFESLTRVVGLPTLSWGGESDASEELPSSIVGLPERLWINVPFLVLEDALKKAVVWHHNFSQHELIVITPRDWVDARWRRYLNGFELICEWEAGHLPLQKWGAIGWSTAAPSTLPLACWRLPARSIAPVQSENLSPPSPSSEFDRLRFLELSELAPSSPFAEQ